MTGPLLFQIAFILAWVILMVLFCTLALRGIEKNAVDARSRRVGRLFISLLLLTFNGGAIARGVQQYTGSPLADALVPIFGGLFLLAMAWPLFLPQPWPRVVLGRIVAIVAGALLIALAVAVLTMGLSQLLSVVR